MLMKLLSKIFMIFRKEANKATTNVTAPVKNDVKTEVKTEVKSENIVKPVTTTAAKPATQIEAVKKSAKVAPKKKKPVTATAKADEVKVETTATATKANTVVVSETAKTEAVVKKDTRYAKLCVVLDPGHAKTTPGKRSPYSSGKQKMPALPLEEWKFNREIVKMLKARLEEWGIEVFVTTDEARDKNADLGLTKRAMRANEYVKKSGKKGLFISVHADAHGYGDEWTSANGWSAYTTPGKTKSDDFAEYLYDAAEKILKPKGISIRTDKSDGDRDKESNFTVIVKANMPAVLTENLFYTNIKDTEFMSSDEGKKAIVDVHLQGILNYAEKYL